MPVAEQTIGRLSLYRRLLDRLRLEGARNVYSHELAAAARVTAAQVRRDLMVLGHRGSPRHGYDVIQLILAIGRYLDMPGGQRVAVIGIGNLGRALLAFFVHRRPSLPIVCGFDSDPAKFGQVIHGCRVHPLDTLADAAKAEGISIAVIAVPASAAQKVAERCVEAGIRGILNFAPVRLRVPSTVHVSDVDLTMSLEKVAFFARHNMQFRGNEDATRG